MARTTFFSFSVVLVLQAVLSGLSVAYYLNLPIYPDPPQKPSIGLPVPQDRLIRGSLLVFQEELGNPSNKKVTGCINTHGQVAHIKSLACRREATHAVYRTPRGHILLANRTPQKLCGIRDTGFVLRFGHGESGESSVSRCGSDCAPRPKNV